MLLQSLQYIHRYKLARANEYHQASNHSDAPEQTKQG